MKKERGFVIPASLLPFIPGKDLLIKVAIIVVIVVLIFGIGFTKGAAKEQKKHLNFLGEQAAQSSRLLAKRVEIVRQIETQYVYRDRNIVTKGETIVREVPVYVTKADDSRCDVNVGFVRSYNTAVANNPDPAPASDSDRAASGVPLSAVAEASAFNLTLGHRWREKALTCIGAYEAVRLAR